MYKVQSFRVELLSMFRRQDNFHHDAPSSLKPDGDANMSLETVITTAN